MQSKEYIKIKARKFAKQTWAGPGKFGVFIIICIIIIATFESLGLSNREKNLELRSVPLVAVQLNLKNIEEGVENNGKSEQNSTLSKVKPLIQDLEFNKEVRENMILSAAVDQYLYENTTLEEEENEKGRFRREFNSELNNDLKDIQEYIDFRLSEEDESYNSNSTAFASDEDELDDLEFFDI